MPSTFESEGLTVEGVRESFARTCRELADLIQKEPGLEPFRDAAAELLADADAILADPLFLPARLRAQVPKTWSDVGLAREVLSVLDRLRNPTVDGAPDEVIRLAGAFYAKTYFAFSVLWHSSDELVPRYYGWEGRDDTPPCGPGPCALRVWGTGLEPAEIEEALGSSPGHVHVRPDLAVVWALRPALSQRAPMGDQIRQLLGSLSPDPAVWERITSRFEADIYAYAILPEDPSELTLDAELLTLLSTRHLSLHVKCAVTLNAGKQAVAYAKRWNRTD